MPNMKVDKTETVIDLTQDTIETIDIDLEACTIELKNSKPENIKLLFGKEVFYSLMNSLRETE